MVLQISHLTGMDGKIFTEAAGLAKGKSESLSPVCMRVLLLVQRVPCNLGDKQTPSSDFSDGPS